MANAKVIYNFSSLGDATREWLHRWWISSKWQVRLYQELGMTQEAKELDDALGACCPCHG